MPYDQDDLTQYYTRFHDDTNIPEQHIAYLRALRDELGIYPKVIYDIGAAVLHWYKNAREIWPEAQIFVFDAVRELAPFYAAKNVPHSIDVFSDTVGRELTFYCHPIYLGGNSYYKESEEYSAAAANIYTPETAETRITNTIDNVVAQNQWPAPDFVKLDVQGAELDILHGMPTALQTVQHLIVELQHVQYNLGAKLVDDALPVIGQLGFTLVQRGVNPYLCGNGPDADYHFSRT
jgi:FkbM family methyltransferase